MSCFIVHLGDPNNDTWWSTLLDTKIIAAGVDNVPGDRAEKALRENIEEGDFIAAYSPGNGFVGIGLASSKSTYRLARTTDLPIGYESANRHQRDVSWQRWAPSLSEAVPAGAYGAIPQGFCTRVRDPQRASHLVSILLERQGWQAGTDLQRQHNEPRPPVAPDLDAVTIGEIKRRRGQGAFRDLLLAAYNKRCAISGCRDTEVLDAAHVTPHREEVNYDPANGLLLRTDLHTLFDLRLLSVDPQTLQVFVSQRISDAYQKYAGRKLSLPESRDDQPSPQKLMSHFQQTLDREKRFLAGRPDDDLGFDG